MPQDWFSSNAPKPTTSPATGDDWFAANQSNAAPAEDTGGLAGFAREWWKRNNPAEIVKGLVHLAGDVTAPIRANPQFLADAEHAAKSGDYATAARKVLSFMSMGLGSDLDAQADLLQHGRYAEGAGAMTGMATNMLLPAGAGKLISGARVPGMATALPAEDAAAVAYGQAGGVPVDAGTATGNQFVQHIQGLADTSPVGAVVAQRARSLAAERMATLGEQLAAKAHPAAVTGEQAGEAAQQAVRGVVAKQRGIANEAYGRVRTAEADPASLRTVTLPAKAETLAPLKDAAVQMPMAVDLTRLKAAVQPIHAALAAEAKLVPLMGPKGSAYVVLDRIINGPDHAPLSVADSALSDLKRMARSNDPNLRNVGQGIAAKAVSELHQAVTTAATDAGSGVLDALTEGRQATVAKYAAADVLKKLAGAKGTREPVAAFRGMTQAGDASLGHLRAVLKQAPETRPLIGRAVLDGLLESKAGPAKVLADWNRLGPETKGLLFDASHVQELDNFFRLAKRMAESPNPSGTALTLHSGSQLALVFSDPAVGVPTVVGTGALSKLLHSEAGVKLLTRGFRLPGGSKVATTGYIAALLRAIGPTASTSPALAPALAGQSDQRSGVRP